MGPEGDAPSGVMSDLVPGHGRQALRKLRRDRNSQLLLHTLQYFVSLLRRNLTKTGFQMFRDNSAGNGVVPRPANGPRREVLLDGAKLFPVHDVPEAVPPVPLGIVQSPRGEEYRYGAVHGREHWGSDPVKVSVAVVHREGHHTSDVPFSFCLTKQVQKRDDSKTHPADFG